jgi:hypothetical protein
MLVEKAVVGLSEIKSGFVLFPGLAVGLVIQSKLMGGERPFEQINHVHDVGGILVRHAMRLIVKLERGVAALQKLRELQGRRAAAGIRSEGEGPVRSSYHAEAGLLAGIQARQKDF